jgi:hypothetical protein
MIPSHVSAYKMIGLVNNWLKNCGYTCQNQGWGRNIGMIVFFGVAETLSFKFELLKHGPMIIV